MHENMGNEMKKIGLKSKAKKNGTIFGRNYFLITVAIKI